MACLLRETFRTSDIVGRWGGDEFVAIATATDQDNPQTITSRLIENKKLHGYNEMDIRTPSLSIGSVYRHPARTRGIDDLIAEADAAMYRCRRTGRSGEPS